MSSDADDLRLTLARNLAASRRAKGSDWTQQHLADQAGVSRATVVQIEGGEGDIKLSTMADLAGALDMSPMLLLMGESELDALRKMLSEPGKVDEITSSMTEADARPIANLPRAQKKAATVGAGVATAAGLSGAAAAGAAIGMIALPGVGTAIGAVLGSLLGARLGHAITEKADRKARP